MTSKADSRCSSDPLQWPRNTSTTISKRLVEGKGAGAWSSVSHWWQDSEPVDVHLHLPFLRGLVLALRSGAHALFTARRERNVWTTPSDELRRLEWLGHLMTEENDRIKTQNWTEKSWKTKTKMGGRCPGGYQHNRNERMDKEFQDRSEWMNEREAEVKPRRL